MYSAKDLGKRYIKLLTYQPHTIQEKLHTNACKIRAYFGGNRSGKTTFGAVETLWWCLGMHRYRDDIPEPPINARVCCTDFINGIQKIILPEFKKWLPEGSYHWHAEPRVLELENGSNIECLSYDQDVSKYGGVSRELVWMDEEGLFSQYTENLMRTVDVGGSILMSMTPIRGLCFDDETEILSEKGWVNYKSVNLGDNILTLSISKEILEWKPVEGLYANLNYNGPMVSMKCQGFDALVTPDHKWPVINDTTDKLVVKETKDLKTYHKIYRALKNDIESKQIYEDWFVELAGWFLTDGSAQKGKRYIKIYQSKTRYPENCKKIKVLLLSCEDYTEKEYPYPKGKGISYHWTVKGYVAERLRSLFPGRELTSEFVFSLTKNQQELLYNTLLNGDGCRKNTSDEFRCTENTADSFQLLCVLLGKRSTKRYEVNSRGTILIKIYIQQENGRYSPFTHIRSLKRKEIHFEGIIWCPHTDNNTVIARRNGTIYISHNSWVYDSIYESQDSNIHYEVATIWDNPYLNRDEIKLIEQTMHPDEKEVRLEGRFIPKSGLIYKDFSDKHIIPWFKIPDDWTIVLGIDPHDRTPHAIVFCAINKDGDVFVFDEIYEHCLLEDLAKTITNKLKLLNRRGEEKPRPAYSVIDTSAKTQEMITGRSYKEELGAKYGLFCIDAHKNINAGISKVREYLNYNNKAPNLFVMEHCRHMIREFRHYIWDDFNKKDRLNPKETPLKKDDHLLDCHDNQTEILAEGGWKLFGDLTKTEKVATLNPDTWHLEYQLPTGYVERPYNGPMILCDGMTTNFCVTPNHRLYSSRQYNYKIKKNNKFELGTIDKFGIEFPIKKDAIWNGELRQFYELGNYKIPMKDWLEFLGVYLAEGFNSYSHYQTLIAQFSNSKYFKDIEKILLKLPFKFKYDKSCKRFYCMNKTLYEEVVGLGKSQTKYIPQNIKNLSTDLLKYLFYGLMLGDGTIEKDCAVYSNDKYDSVSKQLIDNVQELALKIGKYGNVKSYKGNQFISPTNRKIYNGSRTFRINFSRRNGYTTVNIKRNIEKIDYTGTICCVSVPNGIIYTRRNGCSMWGGNSLRYVLMTNPYYQIPKRQQKVPNYVPLYESTGY